MPSQMELLAQKNRLKKIPDGATKLPGEHTVCDDCAGPSCKVIQSRRDLLAMSLQSDITWEDT